MKLTRKQELYLIDLGLETLLSKLVVPRKSTVIPWNKGKKGLKWSKERHAKYAKTMEKKWGKNRKKVPTI